jgi:hypothetical protein
VRLAAASSSEVFDLLNLRGVLFVGLVQLPAPPRLDAQFKRCCGSSLSTSGLRQPAPVATCLVSCSGVEHGVVQQQKGERMLVIRGNKQIFGVIWNGTGGLLHVHDKVVVSGGRGVGT